MSWHMEQDTKDKAIKQLFEQRELQPSRSLWDRIEAELDEPAVVQLPKKKQPTFWVMIAAALTLFVGITVVWQWEVTLDPASALTQNIEEVNQAVVEPDAIVETSTESVPAQTQYAYTAKATKNRQTKGTALEVQSVGNDAVATQEAMGLIPEEVLANDARLLQIALSTESATANKVNPNKLLQSVDQNKKEQPAQQKGIKDFLDHKYQQVRYAISTRNYESN